MKKKQFSKIISIFMVMVLLVSGITASASKKYFKLNKSKITMYIGQKTVLKVIVQKKYKKKISKIKWSSTNKKIAVVNKKGQITAKKQGKTYIKVNFLGKTAKCLVTVKKKNNKKVNNTPKPTASPKPTAVVSMSPKPTESAGPEITTIPESSKEPEITKEPVSTEEAGETNLPQITEGPVITVSPTENPGDKPSPTSGVLPTTTPVASPITTPVVSSSPSPGIEPDGKLKPVLGGGPVKAYGVGKIDDEVMTIYLVDRNYDGKLNIEFKGKAYTVSGKVKDALVMLDTTYITKTNSAKTITVERKSPEVYWTVTNLDDNSKYYFRVERRNTYDTSYANCGALYFKGDVTSVVSVY